MAFGLGIHASAVVSVGTGGCDWDGRSRDWVAQGAVPFLSKAGQ